MVHLTLPQIIASLRNSILDVGGLETAFYLSCSGKEQMQSMEDFHYGDERIAFAGYASLEIDKEKVEKLLSSKPVKGISFRSNIYKLLGVGKKLKELNIHDSEIDIFFKTSNYKYRYIISKFLYNDFVKLIADLKFDDLDNNIYANLIGFLLTNYSINQNLLCSFLEQNDLDAIDLIILEDLEKKLMSIKVMDLSSIDIVLKVLNNFTNSIKRITTDRYKDRNGIEIKDEYDIQDILFSLLKGIFPNLQRENPLEKQAGISSRIDLHLPSEDIMIEVKMIKEADNNHKKYIHQLKEDIVNYSSDKSLKHLIFFTYDPFKKTTDENDFKELENILRESRPFEIYSVLSN